MRASLPRAVTVLAAVLALVAPMSPTASAAPTIPTPEQYFGFRIGTDGRLAMLDQMIGYFKLVADRSDRIDYTQLGRTTLGNPYSLLTISSRRNLDNLDRLVGINRRLADPRGLSDAEADRLAREGRPFYYVQAGIHANEVGNSQAMLEIAHRLATEHSPYVDRPSSSWFPRRTRTASSSSTTTSTPPPARTTHASTRTSTRSTPAMTTTATGSCSPRSSPG
jgi:hypothetical protein